MIAKVKKDPRDIAAEKEVIRLIEEYPGKLDFYDVVNRVPKRSRVYKGEAKAALVHMINTCQLIESPNRKISVAEKSKNRQSEKEKKTIMARKGDSKSYKIVPGRIIDSEKVLKEMQKKRAKIRAIVQQMRKNKRVSREAMQRLIRK
jgi:Zn-dependent M32 family carboxypeptidase